MVVIYVDKCRTSTGMFKHRCVLCGSVIMYTEKELFVTMVGRHYREKHSIRPRFL